MFFQMYIDWGEFGFYAGEAALLVAAGSLIRFACKRTH